MAGLQENPPAYDEQSEIRRTILRVPQEQWFSFAGSPDGLGLDAGTISSIAPDSGNITPEQKFSMANQWATKTKAQMFSDLVTRYLAPPASAGASGVSGVSQNFNNSTLNSKVMTGNVAHMNVS